MHNRLMIQNKSNKFLIFGDHSEYVLMSDFNMGKTHYYSA